MRHETIAPDEAQSIALQVLGFLAEDQARFAHFLETSGLDPRELRGLVSDQGFLAGLLGYLMNDEQLLLVFASQAGHEPETVCAACDLLSGRGQELRST